MQRVQEVLRLKYQGGLSNRQIETLGLASRSSVSDIVKRFEANGLSVEAALSMKPETLESHLYPSSPSDTGTAKPHPDWLQVHKELGRKGMTRLLLWQEYKERHPDGYGYSQFKAYYRRFLQTLNPSMRQVHLAGDALFVDFSGLTMPLVDAITGEVGKAQIFVAVLGASGHTFVCAAADQSTQSFIECHTKAFDFFGGVPNRLVPDNLKAAVISHVRGKVVLNESYADMARYYGVGIAPARPRSPKDEGKVEAGVKGIQRWILMKLRHRSFFSLDELNDAIAELLDSYNAKVVRRLGQSRQARFDELDKPALHPLPKTPYRYREHKRLTVGIDYHIEIQGCGYSAPYTLIGKKVDVWYSYHQVEIVHQGQTVAVHPRILRKGEDSTLMEHMPPEHRWHTQKWHPGRILNWAQRIGPSTVELMQALMEKKSHPARGLKSCLAILRFEKDYGKEALELCAKRAMELNIRTVASIETILKRKTYLAPGEEVAVNNTLFNTHANVRGSAHYQ